MKVIQSLLCGLILMHAPLPAGALSRFNQIPTRNAEDAQNQSPSTSASFLNWDPLTIGFVACAATFFAYGIYCKFMSSDEGQKISPRELNTVNDAIKNNDRELIQKYIDRGGPITYGVRFWDFDTACLAVALDHGTDEIIKLLAEASRLQRQDEDHKRYFYRFLEKAVKNNRLDAFAFLLSNGFLDEHWDLILPLVIDKNEFLQKLLPHLKILWQEAGASQEALRRAESKLINLCAHNLTDLDKVAKYIELYRSSNNFRFEQMVGFFIEKALDASVKTVGDHYEDVPNDKNPYFPALALMISTGGIDYQTAQYWYYDDGSRTFIQMPLLDLIHCPNHAACFAIEEMIQLSIPHPILQSTTDLPSPLISIIREYATISTKPLLHAVMRACNLHPDHYQQAELCDDIKKFLAADSSPDEQFYHNKSALMYAAQAGRKDIVELLVEKRANQLLCDHHGMTALMYAAEQGHADIVAYLLENIHNDGEVKWLISLKNKQVNQVRRKFVARRKKHGARKLVKYIRRGVITDYTHEDGWNNALMLAAKNGHGNVVELLLTHGADRNKQNVRRKTALELAREGREQQQSPDAQLRYDAVIKLLQG